MQVHGRDEKAQDERDIYTDRKTGVVGNIRLSRDPYFVKKLQQRFEHRADKYIQKSRICGDSLKRIQRDMPKETACSSRERRARGQAGEFVHLYCSSAGARRSAPMRGWEE